MTPPVENLVKAILSTMTTIISLVRFHRNPCGRAQLHTWCVVGEGHVCFLCSFPELSCLPRCTNPLKSQENVLKLKQLTKHRG